MPGTCLVVVDVQTDFCPAARSPCRSGDEVVPLVNRLAARFEHVVLTQDWHPAGHISFASTHPGKKPFETIQLAYGPQILWPDHCVQGTAGCRFPSRAESAARSWSSARATTATSTATRPSSRTTARPPTGLAGYLSERRLERLYVCGLATDFCVAWSALDARAAGFDSRP